MATDHMVGQVLGDRYRLQELLAEEELGKVYAAQGPHGTVDVKLLKPLDHQNPERMARFGREMLASAALHHPNCVTMLDFGEQGVFHYAVFEHLAGERLSEALARGPLDAARTAAVALGVARALGAAHAEGILHRNLHPGNVQLLPGGAIKVRDFGLCRLDEAEGDQRLTARGTRVGRPEYMSPEYVKYFDVGPRGDLYALGVLCWEMLAGRVPFSGPAEEVLKLQADVAVPAVSEVVPGVPPWLDAVVSSLCEKGRNRRPGDAAAVVEALEKGLATPAPRAPRSWWPFR